MISAWVVGMPCGRPLYTFNVPFLRSLAASGPELSERYDLVILAVHHQHRYGDLLQVFGVVGL